MTKDYHRISLTAKLTAYMRQFSDVPFAKDVAEYIHAGEAMATLLENQENGWEGLMWYAPMFEMRYKSIAEAIRKSKIKHILELASGFSLRGLAMTEDSGLTYVETDLEALNSEKASLLSKLSDKYGLVRAGNHHLVTANAMEDAQLLAATGIFSEDQPVAVVTEGLLPYLSVKEREKLTKNVCRLLKKFGGVWITPDFTLKAHMAHRSERQKRFHQAIAKATGRALWANAFENEAGLQAFFQSLGLQAQVFRQADLVPHLVSENLLDEQSRQFWQRMKPILSVWVLAFPPSH
jgi:O-methyltransferase involved in polyketide biosynthesis